MVVTHHDNLRRDPATGSAGSVYVDTDPRDRGPEFVFAAAYFRGSDYQLLRTEGFGSTNWGRRVSGFHELDVDYAQDKARITPGSRRLNLQAWPVSSVWRPE